MIVIYSECDLLSAGRQSSLFEGFGIELLQIAIAKSISEQFTSARGARIKAAQTTDSRSVSTSSRLPVSAEFSVEKIGSYN